VTNDEYTIQRPLVMDWRNEYKLRDIGDEFMYGSVLLVAPVLEATTRSVYLLRPPLGTISGQARGCRAIRRSPYRLCFPRFPLYARAGATLPLGPARDYASQDPQAPIELRVYTGDDGQFELYQDAGDGYVYEKVGTPSFQCAGTKARKL
jgi:alpha-D-xyloside xylohydrolase